MCRTLAPSVEGRGSNPRSGQVKHEQFVPAASLVIVHNERPRTGLVGSVSV